MGEHVTARGSGSRAQQRRAQLSPDVREYAARLARTIDFRSRLTQLRATLGLTQSEAARITGENQGDISRLESGELNPSLARMNRILDRLAAYASSPGSAPDASAQTSAKALVSASTAASYLCAAYDDEDSFTALKLQKLLYYAQGYALALLGRPLFSERIKAWQHGPVVPQVWHDYKEYESAKIPRPDAFDSLRLDPEARRILDRVYTEFGQYEAWRLREMTHSEPPWSSTPNGDAISVDALRSYFSGRLAP